MQFPKDLARKVDKGTQDVQRRQKKILSALQVSILHTHALAQKHNTYYERAFKQLLASIAQW